MDSDANAKTARTLGLAENSAGRGVILTALGLMALGIILVHSALMSVSESSTWYTRVDMRHTLFAAVAAMVLLLGWRVNYR